MSSYAQNKGRLAFALCVLAVPALIFYLVLYKTAVNLPLLDDYQSILETANSISQAHGVLSKVEVVLTKQHNGYKQVTNNVLVWACYQLTGQVKMLPLIAIGNAFSLLIFLPVALMARPPTRDTTTRLLFLIPAAYFIFQLQYASALNFASCSIQEVGVIAFSLLSIYFLSRESHAAFTASCVAAVLAILSSPNGFFLAPVGFFMLVQRREWKRLACWTIIFCLMLGLYMFRYSAASSTSAGGTAATSSHSINLVYALAFLGASAARYISLAPALILGVALCGVVGMAAAKRYNLQNPAVFYSMIFILINAIAVSGLRSDLGIAQSLASRYRIYSNLMLVFSYFFIAETILPQWKSSRMRTAAFVAITAVSMIFCLLSDMAGARFLEQKKIALTQSYRVEWQKSIAGESIVSPEIGANPVLQRQIEAGVYKVNLPILQESVRLGVYQPPLQP